MEKIEIRKAIRYDEYKLSGVVLPKFDIFIDGNYAGSCMDTGLICFNLHTHSFKIETLEALTKALREVL